MEVATTDAVPPKVRFTTGGAFHRELQQRADAYFAGPGGRTRDLSAMYAKSAVILTWFVGSWALLVFVAKGAAQGVACAVSLGLSIATIGMAVQHDANHGATSSRPWVNRLFGFTLDVMGVSSFIWRQKHNVIHHTYTNVEGVDFDLDFGLLARLTPEQPWRPWHRYQHLYCWFFYGLLLPKWVFVDDFTALFSRRLGAHTMPKLGRSEVALFAGFKIFFLAWAIVIPALYHPIWQVALFHMIAVFTLGITLAAMFQVAHCVGEANFPPATSEPGARRDWAEQQMETTVDFARGNRPLAWFLGGLSYQVEHHLFPKVCHLHYPALAELVGEVAAKHGIEHRTSPTLRSAVAAHVRHVRRLGSSAAER